MAELVGDETREHLGDVRHGIGGAFNDPEGGGRYAEHGQEARKDDRRGLVAEVTQRTGDAHAGHGAVEPTQWQIRRRAGFGPGAGWGPLLRHAFPARLDAFGTAFLAAPAGERRMASGF